MPLSLKREDSTCRDAPLSSRSHPLAKSRPLRNTSLRRLLSNTSQYDTANQHQCVPEPLSVTTLLCVFLLPRETPPLRVTPPAIVTPPLNVTPPLSVALISVTPLDRYRPHYVGIGSAGSGGRMFCHRPLERREVPGAHAPFQDPVRSLYPTLSLLRWLLPPVVGGIANHRLGWVTSHDPGDRSGKSSGGRRWAACHLAAEWSPAGAEAAGLERNSLRQSLREQVWILFRNSKVLFLFLW